MEVILLLIYLYRRTHSVCPRALIRTQELADKLIVIVVLAFQIY